MDKVFRIFETEEAAVAALESPAAPPIPGGAG
jgi:hypothetical protein